MDLSRPSVTVVIPTYNRAQMVIEAVNSVFAQTYTDHELIVIDDGSSDENTVSPERFFGEVKYHYQEHAGPSAARNRGIALARGDLVAFLDSDDLWLPEKLERQVRFLESHPEFPLCYTDEIWIRQGRRVNQGKRHRKYGGWIFARILPLCIISPSSVLLRKRLLEEVGLFDEELPACEDYDMWLRIACRYPVGYLPERLIVKRGGHSDQLSKTVEALDQYRIRSLVKLIESGTLVEEQRRLAIEQLREKCGIYAAGCMKRERAGEGRYYLKLAERFYREVPRPEC